MPQRLYLLGIPRQSVKYTVSATFHTNLTELSMQNLCSTLSQHHHLPQIMTTPFKDYNQSFTGSGTESLSRLLQEVALENRPSVVTLQLTFLTKENGSVTWLSKNQTAVQLSDLCQQPSDDLSILESMIDLS